MLELFSLGLYVLCQIQLQDSHFYRLLYICVIFSNILEFPVLKAPKSKASNCHIKPQLYPESRHTVGLIWNVFLSTGFGQRKSSVNSAGHNTSEHLQREKAPTVAGDGNPPITGSCSKANENAASAAFARCLGSGHHPAAPRSDSHEWSHPTSSIQVVKGETFYESELNQNAGKQKPRQKPGLLSGCMKTLSVRAMQSWSLAERESICTGQIRPWCVSLWFGAVWVRLACYSVENNDVISQFVWICSQIASRINKSIALFEGPFMVAFLHYPMGRNTKFYCSFNEESIEKC